MSFRTVVITNKSKLNYKNNYLVVKQDNDEKYIHLSEIDNIVIETLDVSITSYLLKELTDKKISILFCDERHDPYGELTPLYGRCNTTKKIKEQIKWNSEQLDILWSLIVFNKIKNQADLLRKNNLEKYDLLYNYCNEVESGDYTNREGHAAKVYFNSLFGKNFSRDDANSINSALNYGYSILLSMINKEVVSNGYLTQLGIHHINEFNDYNLSCDLMEPFRIVIDEYVYNNLDKSFNIEYKHNLINLFNNYYEFDNKKYTLKDVIKLYVKNTLTSIDEIQNYKVFDI